MTSIAEEAKPRLVPVQGGWMAISVKPRVAVIGETKEDALKKLGDELDAWEAINRRRP